MVAHFAFLIKLEEEKGEGDNKDGESLLAKTVRRPKGQNWVVNVRAPGPSRDGF